MAAPRYCEPTAWAASSTTDSPYRRASAQMASIAHGRPPRCTGMTARVRAVIRSAIQTATMFPSWPMSASTGVAPACTIVLTVEQNVSGVVMTSSPGPIPSAARARWSPAVAELTASAWGAPTYVLNSVSNRAVLGPVVSHPDRKVAATSVISSSSIVGKLYGTTSFIGISPLGLIEKDQACPVASCPADTQVNKQVGTSLS